MPWRSFVNDQFETTETTDMSTAKLESMLNAGWREAQSLELQLAQLCRNYGPDKVSKTLAGLIHPVDFKEHERPARLL